MRIFAIADPHLSTVHPKPMDIFGANWHGHPQSFFNGWKAVIQPDDWVLVAGDISWAMHLPEALPDLNAIADLPGHKVLLRGNHDYWWPSISRLRGILPPQMHAIQHDAMRIGDWVIAGTRGWVCPGHDQFSPEDERIYKREVERLRLSLQAARKLGDRLILMLHYPPTNAFGHPSGFTQLIEEFAPEQVVYGHLHGVNPDRLIRQWSGIPLHCVAADVVRFSPLCLVHQPVAHP